MAGLLLYYITDRSRFPGDDTTRRGRLLDRIAAAADAGIAFIQLREKDLPASELEEFARSAVERLQDCRWSAQLLINGRVDIAIASGAHGVHLPANDISAEQARRVFAAAGLAKAIVAVSCHSLEEVDRARNDGADFVVFGPVFEKSGSAGVGLDALRAACAVAGEMPVLALGGVTPENAPVCVAAGVQGWAAIRMFQHGDLADIVHRLRGD